MAIWTRDNLPPTPQNRAELEQVLRFMREAGEEHLEVEASVFVPDGLMVTLKDGEHARRFAAMVKALLPAEGRDLVEISDRRVLLRWPPWMEYVIDQPSAREST